MMRDTNDAIALQRKYYADSASRYEEMHEHEGSGDPLHMDFIVSMLQMLQVRMVLDVGTASGRTLRNLKTASRAIHLWN